MSPEPYDPALDTAVDPRDVDPSWRDDPDVDLDFMALDLSLFTEDDIFESPDYWDELLGRALTEDEQFYLQGFKQVEAKRANWGKTSPAMRGDSAF